MNKYSGMHPQCIFSANRVLYHCCRHFIDVSLYKVHGCFLSSFFPVCFVRALQDLCRLNKQGKQKNRIVVSVKAAVFERNVVLFICKLTGQVLSEVVLLIEST